MAVLERVGVLGVQDLAEGTRVLLVPALLAKSNGGLLLHHVGFWRRPFQWLFPWSIFVHGVTADSNKA